MKSILNLIKSHHFNYWHQYDDNVNLTYVDCTDNITLPRYSMQLHLHADINEVNILNISLYYKIFFFVCLFEA